MHVASWWHIALCAVQYERRLKRNYRGVERGNGRQGVKISCTLKTDWLKQPRNWSNQTFGQNNQS